MSSSLKSLVSRGVWLLRWLLLNQAVFNLRHHLRLPQSCRPPSVHMSSRLLEQGLCPVDVFSGKSTDTSQKLSRGVAVSTRTPFPPVFGKCRQCWERIRASSGRQPYVQTGDVTILTFSSKLEILPAKRTQVCRLSQRGQFEGFKPVPQHISCSVANEKMSIVPCPASIILQTNVMALSVSLSASLLLLPLLSHAKSKTQ